MIVKLLSILTYTVTLALAAILLDVDANVLSWSDLGIINQVQVICGLCIMTIITMTAIVIFRSVWIRQGYEGLDGKLEGKEVALMLSHVVAFGLLVVFVFMITFSPYMKDGFPDYAYWICASGFVGPEIYLLINFLKQWKDKNLKADGSSDHK